MYPFQYHRPANLAEATALLGKLGEGKALAGGQTLIAAMKLRLAQPSDLVDLGGIAELSGIRADGDTIVIGALTRHADVAASAEVGKRIPALARLAGGIGDRQVRAAGTLGGSIANNDPAADYPAGVLGLGATVVTSRRSIAADDFFSGLYETALEPGELIKSVSFPVPQRAGYAKFANPASRFALIGVFVCQEKSGAVRVAVTGGGNGVFRSVELEKALAASFTPAAAAAVKLSADGFSGDLHASPEYRAHLVSVMAGRAVAAALG
ncbi:MAG TPA: xanthine dehydrogenase family protein subunit M [Candidatus Desulfobacillus sp.]|nr:xanthine dehydrogenase family protein subunit M [Candidatus Desulfobacillus sp.]